MKNAQKVRWNGKETGYLSGMRPPKMLKLYEALNTLLIQKDRSFHGT